MASRGREAKKNGSRFGHGFGHGFGHDWESTLITLSRYVIDHNSSNDQKMGTSVTFRHT